MIFWVYSVNHDLSHKGANCKLLFLPSSPDSYRDGEGRMRLNIIKFLTWACFVPFGYQQAEAQYNTCA